MFSPTYRHNQSAESSMFLHTINAIPFAMLLVTVGGQALARSTTFRHASCLSLKIL